MTVPTTKPAQALNADGVTTVFPFTFKVQAPGDVEVITVDANGNETGVAGNQYTITLSSGGGSVTFNVAPANGLLVFLRTQAALSQSYDLKDKWQYDGLSSESALDQIAILLKQIEVDIERCIKIPQHEVLNSLTVTFSAAISRANAYVVFDANGNITTTPAANGMSGFTPGSVVFGGSNGFPAQDNANIFYDVVNKRLGIGTAAPAVALDVVGAVRSSSLTASRLLASDASKGLASVAALSSWVAGTTNQVTVTDNGTGGITLALPQSIHTGASPTFAGLTLSGLTAGGMVFTGTGGLVSVSSSLTWDNTNFLLTASGSGAGSATYSVTFTTRGDASGTNGLAFKRTATSGSTAFLGFSLWDTAARWGCGLDANTTDFSIAYDLAIPSDVLRMSSGDARLHLSMLASSPSTQSARFVIDSNSADSGFSTPITALIQLSQGVSGGTYDGVSLTKSADTSRNWVNWGQGTAQWRAGFGATPYSWTLNYGSSATASAPGTAMLSIDTSGNATFNGTVAVPSGSASNNAVQVGALNTGIANNAGLLALYRSGNIVLEIDSSVVYVKGAIDTTGAATLQLGSSLCNSVSYKFTLFPSATLSTSMTTGFVNIAGAAGVPTGVPGVTTGVPLFYDTTNNNLYAYNGGWKKANVGGTAVVFS